MTSPTVITAGSGPASGATDTARAAGVYTIAPGYHVSFLAGAAEVAAPFDLIEVVAAHLGGPVGQSRQPGTIASYVAQIDGASLA
jgi:hypothetical protein